MTQHLMRRAVRGIALPLAGVLGLFVLATGAAAQTDPPARPVSFSLLGGINVARLSLPPVPFFDEIGLDVTNGSRTGFIGGFLVEVPATARMAFDTGALVSARGATMTATAPGFGTADGDFRMIYLDIPALVRARVARFGDSRVHLLAGATVGAKLHARVRASFRGQTMTRAFTSDLPAVDVGLTAGGRVDVGRALVVISYTHGLTDTAKGDAPEPIRHRVLSMMAGWRF